jgi:threonine/homoserine/homoserine lactone efflux protein
MGLLESVGFGIALGFSLAVPPGPMNALIASQTVRSLRAGVVTGCGAMTADGILGVVVLSLVRLVDLTVVVRPLYAVGAAMMVYLGLRIIRGGRSRPGPPPGDVRTFSQALGVGITNPFQVGWWLTAGLAFARFGGPVLFAGLFGAIAVWVVGFPLALHAGTARYPRLGEGVAYLSGAIMFGFAGYFAYLLV